MASKVDTSDPQVRKLVYNMYRGILGNYNAQANDIVDSLPKERVQQDQGVSKQLESMIRQSHQIAGGNGGSSSPGGETGVCGPPPPPPLQGTVPTVRIKSEIPQGKKAYEPPAAIQNAMMTKDKKPFTYTPGGLDLAEIKSPRMARRINRNAHMEDSCTPAQERVVQQVPHQPLPPSALAAMQPQIAIPVFPPGGALPSSPLSHPHYQQPQFMPPPPPPPSVSVPAGPPTPLSGSIPPPPPPPLPTSSNNMAGASHLTPSSHETNSSNLQNGQISGRSPPPFLQDIQNRPQLRPVGLPNTQPKLIEPTITAPLKPVAQPPKAYEPPPPPPPVNVQLKSVSPPSSRVESFPPPPPPPVDTRPVQNVRPVVQSPNQLPFHKLDLQAAQAQAQAQSQPPKQTPPSPGNLNKSPAPWMTTRQMSKESPPPWAVRQSSLDENPQSPQSPQYSTRVVPIQIEGRNSPQTPELVRQPPPPPPQQSRPIQPQYTPPPQQQPPFIPVFQAPQYYTTIPTQPVQPRQQQQPQQHHQFQQSAVEQPRTRIIPIQIEGAQTSVDPGRTLQSQTSWTQVGGGNPIQSRSFRVLQKITGSDEDSIASTPVGADASTMWWPPPTPTSPTPTPPPTMYPPPKYWPAHHQSAPPRTPEEQQQFWDHYNAMYAYVMQMNAAAAYCYSPYTVGGRAYLCPPLYPSDSEDCSGYSSSDEMTYYGKMFKQQALLARQTTQPIQSDEPNKLQSIKSVPDIRIFKDSDDSESVTESETDDGDDLDDDRAGSDTESDIPHTLSVIFEDTEPSTSETESVQVTSKTESFEESDEDECSTTSTLNNDDEPAQNDTTVTVRLPLQLSFNRSKDNDEITVVVGAEEVQEGEKNDCLVITDIVREDSDPDVSATICIKKRVKKVEDSGGSESPIDFWKELSKDGERCANETPSNGSDDNEGHWEDDSSSTSIQTIKKGQSEGETCSGSEMEAAPEKLEDEVEIRSDEDYSKSENSSDESSDSSSVTSSSEEEDEEQDNVKEKSAEKEVSTEKQEESDEEDDSGVTSDLSRHISETDTDAECGGELGKMSKYQRTATHSRLFKLLQDECNNAEDEDPTEREDLTARKERLSLPLNTNLSGEQESLSSSSGVNSPTSPTVTDRLVKELVQSLLSRKKGRHFRKLPLEKLHAAALRILQEDMDPYDTSSTSDDSSFFMSPVSNASPKKKVKNKPDNNLSLPNPEAYGGNYQEYCKYYSSWGSMDEADYDIVPSKAFKILHESSPLKIVPVRCPRVPDEPPPPPADPLKPEATTTNPEET